MSPASASMKVSVEVHPSANGMHRRAIGLLRLDAPMMRSLCDGVEFCRLTSVVSEHQLPDGL